MRAWKYATGIVMAVSLLAVSAAIWQARLRFITETERAALAQRVREVAAALQASENQNSVSEGEPVEVHESRGVPMTAPTSEAEALAEAAPRDAARAADLAQRDVAIAEALRQARVRRIMSLEMLLRPKFEALGLSAEQWDRYQTLSLELADHETELRQSGKGGMSEEEFETFVRAATADSVAQMRALLGASAYDELQRFQLERGDPARKAVQALASRLRFSRTPLEHWQEQHLLRVAQSLAAKSPKDRHANAVSEDLGGEVKSVLTPLQFQAWRRLQNQRQMLDEIATLKRGIEFKRFQSERTSPVQVPR